MNRHKIFMYALLTLVLAVAGCGGGGSADRGATAGGAETISDTTQLSAEAAAINQAIADAGADWSAADNPISDLPDEQRKQLNGALIDETRVGRTLSRQALAPGPLPQGIDWRSHNGQDWITPVKNQGSCGACTAFAVTGVAEALANIASGNPALDKDLSEAHLFACGGASCSVGMYTSSAASFYSTTGVVDEACLPYTATSGTAVCNSKCADWSARVTKTDSYAYLPKNDADAVKAALQNGPVMAVIKVYADFYYYKTGIYQYVSGAYQGLHAVAVVGYDDAGGYWIVKNSWGSYWGESGFVKIKYGQIDLLREVIAMVMPGNAAGVTATASPSEAGLDKGGAVTLTCATSGTVNVLEARCHATLPWAPLSTSESTTCTYTATGDYYPECRVNKLVSSVVPAPVRITAVTLAPLGASGGPDSKPQYGPANAFDADPASAWVGQVNAGSWDLYYRFNAPTVIHAVAPEFFNINYLPQSMTLSTSDDGVVWREVGKFSPWPPMEFVGASTTFVKIHMDGNPVSTYPYIKNVSWDLPSGPCSGDSISSWYRPEKAFDADPDTWWVGDNTQTSWILLYNYGAPTTITAADIEFHSVNHMPAQTVLHCKSGDTYTNLGTFPIGPAPHLGVNATCDALRFDMSGNATYPPAGYPVIHDVSITH